MRQKVLNLQVHPLAPRHYNAVFGRTDEAMQVEAMDNEVMKCFDMGTWEIVDTAHSA